MNAIALLGAQSYSRFRQMDLPHLACCPAPSNSALTSKSGPKARGHSQGDKGFTEGKRHSQDLGVGEAKVGAR